MRPRVGYLRLLAMLVMVAAVSVIAHAQGGRGGGGGRGRGEAGPPPPKEATASAIPGVIAAGTRIELVAYPVEGTEGPVRLLDGSGILWTERNIFHISKIDLNGKR